MLGKESNKNTPKAFGSSVTRPTGGRAGGQAGGGHDARQSDIDVRIYQPISILGAEKRQKEVKKVWPDAKNQ